MVLSNKKLKQKLRAELANSLAESVAKPHSNNNGSANPDEKNQLQQPKSLKVLLDSATQRPRLSKREKRRKTLSLRDPEAANRDGSEENNGGGEEEKKELSGSLGLREKKKRKRERDEEEKDGVLGSEENGLEKSNEKKKKNKKKKIKNKKKKAKNEEEKENMVMETNEKNDSQANGNVTTKVYVGGIPYYSTEDDIRSYFEGCGTITEVDCMTFPESGKFRGIAIISFKTEAAAKRALALNGADMGGLFLTIQPYKTDRTNKTSNFAPQVVDGYNRIYVGSLAWDITEEKLRNFFSDCKVTSIRFGMDKETGEFQGYAHVDFADHLSLALALKLDQQHVCGRPIKISCAVPLKKASGTKSRSVPRAQETTDSRAVPTTTETTDLRTFLTTTETTDSRTIPTTTETTDSRTVPTTTETTDSNTGVTTITTGKMKRRTCYDCGEKGHISSNCPKNQAADSTKETAD